MNESLCAIRNGEEIVFATDGTVLMRIMSTGHYKHWSGRVFDVTEERLRAMKENFDNNILGREVIINIDHPSLSNATEATKGRKLGKITAMFVQQDEDVKGRLSLMAKADMNEEGYGLVTNDKYVYNSPEFHIEEEEKFQYEKSDGTGISNIVTAVALTNEPFFEDNIVLASSNGKSKITYAINDNTMTVEEQKAADEKAAAEKAAAEAAGKEGEVKEGEGENKEGEGEGEAKGGEEDKVDAELEASKKAAAAINASAGIGKEVKEAVSTMVSAMQSMAAKVDAIEKKGVEDRAAMDDERKLDKLVASQTNPKGVVLTKEIPRLKRMLAAAPTPEAKKDIFEMLEGRTANPGMFAQKSGSENPVVSGSVDEHENLVLAKMKDNDTLSRDQAEDLIDKERPDLMEQSLVAGVQ